MAAENPSCGIGADHVSTAEQLFHGGLIGRGTVEQDPATLLPDQRDGCEHRFGWLLELHARPPRSGEQAGCRADVTFGEQDGRGQVSR
jgi:hypothetical protein